MLKGSPILDTLQALSPQVTSRAFQFRKKYSDSIFRNESIFSIRFSIYRLLLFTMMSNVNSTLSSWVTLTTSQRRRNVSKISCTALCEIQRLSMGLCHGVLSLIRRMQRPNRMADFLTKLIDSPKRIGESIWISNALVSSRKPGSRLTYFQPGPQLLSQPQSTIALWPMPNYTAWWLVTVTLTEACVCEHLAQSCYM